jgi:hypothetical protein
MITINIPITLYITEFDDVSADFVLLLVMLIILVKLVLQQKDVFREVYSNEIISQKNTELKVDLISIDHSIVKLSINAFRSLTVIITSIAILAVDFRIFPPKNRKTDRYGFGLMDVGVGYFILCHSMRLIRNSSQNEINHQSKKYLFRR